MGKTGSVRRLSRITRTGLTELPDNAVWLLSKALKPALAAASGVSSVGEGISDVASSAADAAGGAGSTVRHKARTAKRSVVEAMPLIGHDSVTALMREADTAADRARDQEARALSFASWASDSARASWSRARSAAVSASRIKAVTES